MAQGDILASQADVLVCSGNVQLNLSGGVGGAILVKYGPEMQEHLWEYLKENRVAVVLPGTVVLVPACGSQFKLVLHAVAIDAFYESSAELIISTISQALEIAAKNGMKTVSLAAFATGYGRFPISGFAECVREIIGENLGKLESVTIFLSNPATVEDFLEAFEQYR